jgi:hypothetical protein
MSYGLVCLTCRRYLVEVVEALHHCTCEKPVPSWDLKTPAERGTWPEWLPAPETEGDAHG